MSIYVTVYISDVTFRHQDDFGWTVSQHISEMSGSKGNICQI